MVGRWKRRLTGAVMLIVVAALPVTATVCEALCERDVVSAATTTGASAHEGMAGCHESPSSSDHSLASASAHCRTHDDGRREAEAAVTSNRMDAVAAFVATTATTLGSQTLTAQSRQALGGYGPPRGSLLSHASLVLRI